MPRRLTATRFARRVRGQVVLVARDSDGPVGFVTLRRDGYIDLAYVLPQAQRRGVLRGLVMAARDERAGPLWTHASLNAQPAFSGLGFHVARHEVVRRRGQRLARAEMREG